MWFFYIKHTFLWKGGKYNVVKYFQSDFTLNCNYSTLWAEAGSGSRWAWLNRPVNLSFWFEAEENISSRLHHFNHGSSSETSPLSSLLFSPHGFSFSSLLPLSMPFTSPSLLVSFLFNTQVSAPALFYFSFSQWN